MTYVYMDDAGELWTVRRLVHGTKKDLWSIYNGSLEHFLDSPFEKPLCFYERLGVL